MLKNLINKGKIGRGTKVWKAILVVRDAEVVGSNPVASTTWQGQPRRSFTDLRGSFFCSEVTCRHGSLDESTKNSYFAFLSVFLSLWFHQKQFWLFSSGIICKNSSYKVCYSKLLGERLRLKVPYEKAQGRLLGVMQPKNFSYEKAQDGAFSGKVSIKRLH